MKRKQFLMQKYKDTMTESLNKNIQENIFPHWRNHRSLKGKLGEYFLF